MTVEIKATGDGACLFNAMAIGLGIEILSGRLDAKKDSPGYIALIDQFARHHPHFIPKSWDNLKQWLGFYNHSRDLELVLAPVLFELNNIYNRKLRPGTYDELINLAWKNHDLILKSAPWHELNNIESGAALFPKLDNLPLASRKDLLLKLKELLKAKSHSTERETYKEFLRLDAQQLMEWLTKELKERAHGYMRGYSCDETKEMMANLSINLIENNSSDVDKTKINLHLINKENHWNVLCKDEDNSHLRSGEPSLKMTSEEAYIGQIKIAPPAIEFIAIKSDLQPTIEPVAAAVQPEVGILNERVDNPGQGNCGFYAFAIGLIHIIKDENTYRSQLMFNRWVSLNSDVASEFKAITDFDFHKPDNELLDRLQSYLRFTLYHYQLTELKRACSHQNSANNYPLLNANSNFTNFAALYYNIPENVNPIYNEFARSEIIKAAIDSVRHLVKNNFESETFVPLFIEMLYGNVDKKTITEETLPSETSPILEALLQITANFEWANHLNLDYLSRAFKVNFHILDNGAPRWKFKDAEGMHTIELNNENNSHWTTQVMFAKAFDSAPTKVAPQKQAEPSTVATPTTPTTPTTTLPADAQASKATLLSTSPASTSKPEEVSPKIKKSSEPQPLPNKDQEKLERLRQQIANATVGYLEYNNSIWFSIFHRHGKTGRIRAQNFNTSFAAINNYDDAKATLISFLKDPQLGNTHPHSFRTMLLNELENNKSGNLQQTSKYFNEKLGKLASELNISLLSLSHKG